MWLQRVVISKVKEEHKIHLEFVIAKGLCFRYERRR